MTGTSGHVQVEGGRLYYERAGKGPTVVLIHAGLWDSRMWDDQFEAFAKRYDVIRYDLRGYGRSDRPTAPYSDVDDLLSLLVFLYVERASLVGMSVGGAIAIDFTLANPEMVANLVPAVSGLSGYEWADPGVNMLDEEVARAVEAGEPERAMEISLVVWAPLQTSPEVDERIRRIAMDNAHTFLIPDDLVRAAPPAVDRLGRIEAPTLVIEAERDVGEIHAIAKLLAERIPGAQKRVIAGADHVVNVRAPQKFNRLVLDFLGLADLG